MTKLFIAVINMSITASYVAIAVILIRLLLKKVPKVFSYALWLAVFIRLVCPFSFNSVFSFFNILKPNLHAVTKTMNYVPYNIGTIGNSKINWGVDSANSSLPTTASTFSINSIQIFIYFASIIWIVGIVMLLTYFVISYFKVANTIKTATIVKDNIFETDRFTTPFLYGFVKPKIYIPIGISHSELSYILAHEQAHIQRLDYLIKPIAFLIVIIHWFNPIMWVSFMLMSKDIEMCCDENVIKKMGNDIKNSYSNSLLSISIKRSGFSLGGHLCFGESNIKSRIKNILNYKKPTLWVIVLIVILIISLIGAFTTNPKYKENIANSYLGYPLETLIKNKTPYVGNNSKVVGLVSAMPVTKGIVTNTVELHTMALPYGITIHCSNVNSYNSINKADFYRNSILLLSLIDNVDIINYELADKSDKNVTTSYKFTYTRSEAEKLIGGDIRHFSASTNTLKKLIDKIKNTSFKTSTNWQPSENAQIERYLETIIFSPEASSNPYDYIKAHRNAFTI